MLKYKNINKFYSLQIVDWLNNASVSNVAMERIKLLTKAQEYLLRKNPELLLELLTDFLGFVTDRNSDVKKTVVGFIEEAWLVNVIITQNFYNVR